MCHVLCILFLFKTHLQMKTHPFLRLLTVASSLYLVSRMSRVKAAGQCGSQSSSYGKALIGHTFDKVKVLMPADCLIRCENEPRCQSLNYVMEDNTCELNNRSKEARPADYVTDPSRIYMTTYFKRGMCSYREFRVENINFPY